jgi:integrase
MDALATCTSTVSALAVAPELVEAARGYAQAATAEATRRAYARQWRAFVAWCEAQQLEALPAQPGTVALYLSHLAESGRKVATVEQAAAAIAAAHRAAGHPSPREDAGLRLVLRGIRRTVGVAQREAAPVLAEHLRAMVEALPDTLAGARDRALLLVGFAGAFRRSELAALTVEDATFGPDGLELHLRRSKTDQEGRGRLVAIPYAGTPDRCPVRALRAWLDAARITSGPLFREVTRHGHVSAAPLTGRSVARVVKRAAAAAGLDASRYSGHSLRAGFVTQAKLKGKAEDAIMRQTGHRSVAVMRKYDRRAELWRDNAAAGLLD